MDNVRNTEGLLFMVLFGHLMLVPFTKVEESFNVQAIHDMLYHLTNLTQYDHLEFPGVVPRTFAGSLSIASTLVPFMPIIAIEFFKLEKFWMLVAARLSLGLMVLCSFFKFARAVEERFEKKVGTFLRLITLTQFHFLFYASRPLPNTFAMALLLYFFAKWLDKDYLHATIYATVAVFIFRFELILLFGPLYLLTLLFEWRTFPLFKVLLTGVCSLMFALCFTIPFDSFLWDRWMWPEGEVIYFNVWLNKSHEYGVLPFWWYFTSAVPRAMLASLPFALFGLFIHQRSQCPLVFIVLPTFLFMILYSFLPHKELRFILYAIPIFNVSAAVFCAWIWKKARFSWLYKAFSLVVAFHLIVNALLTCGFVYASAQNYPGGVALMKLQYQHRFLRNKPISVHIDAFSAENGVSRFLHLFDTWEYNKTENMPSEAFDRFDYLLVGSSAGKLNQEIEKRNLSGSHMIYFSDEAFHKIGWKEFVVPWIPKEPFKLQLPSLVFKQKVAVLKKRPTEE